MEVTMFKVFIVDDETIFREHLKTAIDWEKHGFVISQEARDGIEAIEKIEADQPDIVLVDINMPIMDGLELSEKLKEKYSDIVIVLVTGYSEFEYARRAVKIGVEDYILKPFNSEELIVTLLKVKSMIQLKRNERDEQRRDAELVKEMFFQFLISSEYSSSEEETEKQMRRFGIKLNSFLFMVSSIEIDNIYERWNASDEIILWKNAVSNILKEAIQVQGNHFVFYAPEDRMVSLIEFKNKEQMEIFKTEEYVKLCKTIRNYLNFSVTIGIGTAGSGFSHIRKSYSESNVALQNKISFGNGKVIEYKSLQNEYKNIGFYTGEMNEKLQMSLRLNNWEEIKVGLDEVFGYILKEKLSVEYVYVILMSLVSLCFSYITESGKNIKDIFGMDFSPYKSVSKNQTIEEAYHNIVNIYKTTVDFFGKNKLTRSRKVVDCVMKYVDEHYSDGELSVLKISNSIFVDSSYIRRLFKRELNMTVTDYITEVRMKKAKELLMLGRYKLSEVCEKVGFNDSGYFSKVFKKHYGISPSVYESIKK